MVAIVGGNNFGLNLGSLSSLGLRGQLGSAAQGRSGERAYVNAATGNLVLQDLDAQLIGLGPDVGSLRTYNSLGSYDFDGNADGWQGTPTKAIQDIGSSKLRRFDADGSTCDYLYNSTLKLYVALTGAGSVVDTILKNKDGSWTWTDGATGTKETYQVGTFARITSIVDTAGNTLSFTYTNNLLTSVKTSDGETVTYTYGGASGKNLTEVKTTLLVNGVQQVVSLVTYAYDAQNRLQYVDVKLNPKGLAPANTLTLTNYRTTYTYDGTSARVASITQSDGTTVSLQYTLVGTTYRVTRVTDALGKITNIAYDTATQTTTVTDPLNVSTVLKYDATSGQLTQVKSGVTASNAAGLEQADYTYDALGNVKTIKDRLGRTITFTYDASGNLKQQVDGAGNVVDRTYDARNQLTIETAYAGAGSTQPLITRYVYDAAGKNLLRYVVTAEGRVTEYKYDAKGQRIATVEYRGAAYNVAGLAATAVPTESQMTSWVSGLTSAVKTRSTRTDVGYDFRGAISTVKVWGQVDSNVAGVAGTDSTTTYFYNERGELIKTITPDTYGTTDTIYDGFGRVLSTVVSSLDPAKPVSITTLNKYDDGNNKTSITLANGLVTTSTYDLAGRLASVVQSTSASPNLGTTSYYYDADGRLLMTSDPTGRRTFVFWDAAGRKVAELDATGGLTEYFYDTAGQLTETVRYASAVDPQILPKLVDAGGVPVANVTLDTQFAIIAYEDVWNPDDGCWDRYAVTRYVPLRPAASLGDEKTWRYYDQAGRLSMEVDALGYVTKTDYDRASRVLSVTRYATPVSTATLGSGTGAAPTPTPSADDRVSQFMYDKQGLLRASVDGEGFVTQLVYDASGRLVKSTRYADPVPSFANAATFATALATARTSGDPTGLVPTTGAAKNIETYTYYDAAGRKVAEVDGEKYLTELTYDKNGNLWKTIRYATKLTATITTDTRPTAPAGGTHVLENTWDALGRLWKQKNFEGTVTEYEYDSLGHVIRTTAALGTTDARTLRVRYDDQGRVKAELSAEGAKALEGLTSPADDAAIAVIWDQYAIEYTYDAAGRRITATDARGNRTVFLYDDAGRLRYAVDGAGDVVETSYDALGRIVQTRAYGNKVTNPGALVGGLLSTAANSNAASVLSTATSGAGTNTITSYTYTVRGEVKVTTDSFGGTVTNDYTAFGEVKTTTQSIDATKSILTTKAYDRRGLLEELVADSGDATHLNANTSYEYDAFGRMFRRYDANRNKYEQGFDRLGRVVQTTDPINPMRYTTYDAFDRVFDQFDAFGRLTSHRYDDAERSVTVTTPENISVKTIHDRLGQTITIRDGNLKETTYEYDRNGNLRFERRALDATTTIETSRSYDHANNVIETKEGNGNKVSYTYDAANRVLTRTVDPGGLNYVTTYTHDGRGYQTTVKDVSTGATHTIGYDNKGRVTIRMEYADGTYLLTQYSYDQADRLLSVTDARNVVTQHAYDGLGRRTETIVDSTTGGLNLRTKYGYDQNGNMVRKTDPNQNVTRYVYDALDRLVYTIDALGAVQKNEYDVEGRVTAKISYSKTISTAGLTDTTKVGDVTALIVASPSDVAEYRVYDRDGRVTAIVDTAGSVTKLTYDNNGNVTEKRTYATTLVLATWTDRTVAPTPASSAQDVVVTTIYDAANRAKYVIDGVRGVVEYTYDKSGNVVERRAYAAVLPATTPLTETDVANKLKEIKRDSTGERTQNVDILSRTVYDAAGRTKYTVDGEGGVVEYLYDSTGDVTERIAYATAIPKTTAATAAEISAQVNLVKGLAPDLDVRNAYDSLGRLLWTADGTGAVTRFVYDGNGNVVKKVAYASKIASGAAPSSVTSSAADRVTVFVYDPANRLRFEVDALGTVLESAYDAAGHLTQRIAHANRIAVPTVTTDPASVATFLATWITGAGKSASNRVSSWLYDAAGRQRFAIDAAGAVTENVYDTIGNVIATRAYATVLTPASFGLLAPDSVPELMGYILTTSADDRLTLNAFDAAGRVVYSVDPRGYATRTDYDGAGRITATNLYGRVLYDFTVGMTAAELAAEIEAEGIGGIWDRTDTFQYDAAGNVLAATDRAGNTESYTYSGNHTKLDFTNKTRTAKWTYIHDAAGRLVEEAGPPVDVYGFAGATGEVAAGKTTGQVIRTKLVYDALGNVKVRTEGITGQERSTTYGYDAAGRQVTTKFPTVKIYVGEGAGIATNGTTGAATPSEAEQELVVSVVYDVFGEAVANTDVSKNVSYKVYDVLGRVQYEIDAAGFVTEHVRNVWGDETSLVRYATSVLGARPTLAASASSPPTASAVAAALTLAGTANRTIQTVRDAIGRATLITQPLAYVNTPTFAGQYAAKTMHVYDAFGEVVRTYELTNPGPPESWACTAVHVYDKRGLEIATVDAGGYVTYQHYNAARNRNTLIEYATPIPTTAMLTEPGSTLKYFDVTAFVQGPDAITPAGAEDRVTDFGYDKMGRLEAEWRYSVEYADAGLSEADWFATDASGNRTVKDPTLAAGVATTYEYDEVGNLVATTDALDGVTRTVYDALGRIAEVIGPERTVDVNGVATTFAPLTVFHRDAFGNVVERIEYSTPQDASSPGTPDRAKDRVTLTVYDLRGNATKRRDAAGFDHLMSYDAAGHLAKEWQTVDLHRISVDSETGATTDTVTYTTLFTAYEYDKLGRLIGVITPGSTSVLSGGTVSPISDAAAGTVTTTVNYNAFGEATQKYTVKTGTSPTALDIEFRDYDDAGRVWRTNRGDGQVKVLLHDLRGFQTAELTSAGIVDLGAIASAQAAATSSVRRTTYERDALGRVTRQNLPARSESDVRLGSDFFVEPTSYTVWPYVVMTYDRWGNVLTQTDARNVNWVTTFRYDANDHLVETWQPNVDGVKGEDAEQRNLPARGPRTFVRYDALGRQIAIVDAKGYVNRQVWDAAGQLLKEIHADADPNDLTTDGHVRGTVAYSYDAFGNRVRMTDAMGYATGYEYDLLGQNTTVTSAAVAVCAPDPSDPYKKVVQVGDDRGLVTRKVYDWAGRLIQDVNGDNETTRYTLDRRGQIVATRLEMGETTTAAYDVNGRKIAERDPLGSVATWSYDAFGLLTGKTDIGGATYTFGYDKARQLKTQTNTIPTASAGWRAAQNLAFEYDQAGQLVKITDTAAGRVTTYGYNRGGLRVYEQTVVGGVTYQRQMLGYDALGRLRVVETHEPTGTFTGNSIVLQLQYDLNGNRTLQQTTRYASGTVAATKTYWSSYDRMNRQILLDGTLDPAVNGASNLAQVIDGQGHILTYDKNGNRTSDTFWGQRVVEKDILRHGVEDDANHTPFTWIETTYQLVSTRLKEFYDYDKLNRLVAVKTGGLEDDGNAFDEASGMVLDVRKYDAASRVVRVGPDAGLPTGYLAALGSSYNSDGNGARGRVSTYDEDGRLSKQYVTKPDGTLESFTEFKRWGVTGSRTVWRPGTVGEPGEWVDVPTYGWVSGYDAAGNVTNFQVTNVDGSVTTHTASVAKMDGYREAGRTTTHSGTTMTSASYYDANGFVTSVDVQGDPTVPGFSNMLAGFESDRWFVNDANGVILRKDQNGRILNQLVALGNVMGTYGVGTDPNRPVNDDGTPNYVAQETYDLTYAPITSATAGTGHYTVRDRDTLETIAQLAYGDAELWYVIADANGLSSDADLRVGQTLNLPTRPSGTHSKAGVFKPYDPSKIIGDTTPQIPSPKPNDDSCTKWMTIVVIAIIVVVVTIVTYGAATAALTPALGAFWAGVAAGAAAGAIGSVAAQGLSIAAGLQEDFSWKDVGIGALGGAVTAGLSGLSAASGLAKAAQTWSLLARSALAAAQAAVASAITQGLAIAMHLEDDFSWREVASAAASAAVGEAAGDLAKPLAEMGPLGRMGATALTKAASSTAAALVKGGKIDWVQIGADAFGNALGNEIGGAIKKDVVDAIDELWAEHEAKKTLTLRLKGAPLPSQYANPIGDGQLNGKGRWLDYSLPAEPPADVEPTSDESDLYHDGRWEPVASAHTRYATRDSYRETMSDALSGDVQLRPADEGLPQTGAPSITTPPDQAWLPGDPDAKPYVEPEETEKVAPLHKPKNKVETGLDLKLWEGKTSREWHLDESQPDFFTLKVGASSKLGASWTKGTPGFKLTGDANASARFTWAEHTWDTGIGDFNLGLDSALSVGGSFSTTVSPGGVGSTASFEALATLWQARADFKGDPLDLGFANLSLKAHGELNGVGAGFKYSKSWGYNAGKLELGWERGMTWGLGYDVGVKLEVDLTPTTNWVRDQVKPFFAPQPIPPQYRMTLDEAVEDWNGIGP
jgi:YD repeat-containing protein